MTFQSLGDNRCKVTVIMTYELTGMKEKVGDALGFLSARVEADLRRFKEFIETKQVPTGAWRGEIHEGKVHKKEPVDAFGDVVETKAPNRNVSKKK